MKEAVSQNQQLFTPVKDGLRQRRATGVWYLFLKIDGQLHRECLDTTDKKQAEALRDAEIADIKKANESGVDLKNKLTFGHFKKLYVNHLAYRVKLGPDHDEGCKASTAKTYHEGLRRFEKLWKGADEVPIRDLKTGRLEELLDAIRPTISASQFNRCYIALNEIFTIAVKQKALLVNPLTGVKRSSRRHDRTHIPERAEWDAFIQFIRTSPKYTNSWKEQVVDFLQGLCVTGLRQKSEANNAWKEDVKFYRDENGEERGTLNVRDGKTRTSVRTIDLIPAAIQHLKYLIERYPKGRDLFPIKDCYRTFKHVCGPKGLNLTKLGKRGERKPVRYNHHTCRHIFATLCLENDIEAKTISEWLGHNDGGSLVLKTYGHLRRAHSVAQAAKVTNVNLVGVDSQQPVVVDEKQQILAALSAEELKQLIALAQKIVPLAKAA